MLSCLYLYKIVFNNLMNMDIFMIRIDYSSADITRFIGRIELHSGRPHFVTMDGLNTNKRYVLWVDALFTLQLYLTIAITIRSRPDDEIWV